MALKPHTRSTIIMKFLNKKLFLFLLFSLFLVTGFFIFNNSVQAASSSLDVGLQQVSATGLPSGDIRTIVAKIIKTALGLLGTVALVLMLYAGYLWMTAGGVDLLSLETRSIAYQR